LMPGVISFGSGVQTSVSSGFWEYAILGIKKQIDSR